MHTICNLASYGTDDPQGLVMYAYDHGLPDDDAMVRIEITPNDAAFALCAMIDKWGLDRVRRAIDRIAQDDPEGRRCGISAPMRILQGIDPRKAG